MTKGSHSGVTECTRTRPAQRAGYHDGRGAAARTHGPGGPFPPHEKRHGTEGNGT
jgi:hypothetical protein